MFTPSTEALELATRFQLALRHRARSGAAGERLGPGAGSSTEFQDSRAYQPGDDVRHVDWRALARTGHVMVRQYREEVLPRLDLLLDGSVSMRVEPEKAQLAVDLTAVLAGAARSAGFSVSVLQLGGAPRPREGASALAEPLAFEDRQSLTEGLREVGGLLRPGALRIVISDFLDPHGPEGLVGVIERGSGGWALLQVLGTGDVDPPQDAARRLIDVERDEVLDLAIDAGVRARYLDRLERLIRSLRATCHGRGGRHVDLQAGVAPEHSIGHHCCERLLREGILVPD